MSYLDRLSKKDGVVKHLMHGAVETAEFAGAAYGFGYVQSRFRGQASIKGIPADLIAGIVLKTAAFASGLTGVGSDFAHHVDNVGNAGVAAFFHTLGAGAGAKASGVTRLLIPAGDVQKAKAALPNATVLGAIPQAPKGDYMSSADLRNLARG